MRPLERLLVRWACHVAADNADRRLEGPIPAKCEPPRAVMRRLFGKAGMVRRQSRVSASGTPSAGTGSV